MLRMSATEGLSVSGSHLPPMCLHCRQRKATHLTGHKQAATLPLYPVASPFSLLSIHPFLLPLSLFLSPYVSLSLSVSLSVSPFSVSVFFSVVSLALN